MKAVYISNQVTMTLIKTLNQLKFVDIDGNITTDEYKFYMSAPAFNVKHSTNPIIANFIDNVKKHGAVYDLPCFGVDLANLLSQNTMLSDSIMPFKFGVDLLTYNRASSSVETLYNWLKQNATGENFGIVADNLIDAFKKLQTFMSQYLEYNHETKKWVKSANYSSLTYEIYTRFLFATFGDDWKERSNGFDTSKFLKLFGADDNTNSAFIKGTYTRKNRDGIEVTEQIIGESRWIANCFNMFKLITDKDLGALVDYVNFMAAYLDIDANSLPRDGSNKIPIQITMDIVKKFNEITENGKTFGTKADANIFKFHYLFADMEADDLGPLTLLHKFAPNCIIYRFYPTTEIAEIAEYQFVKNFGIMINGYSIIDPDLGNIRALTQIYKN